MKWFQHSVDSHDDPDISDAEDLFGDAGYNVFFKILELYGREFNNLDEGGNLNISQAFVRRKLRKSWTKVEQILNFYQEKKRIFISVNGSNISLRIPQFIEIASNWTKRPKKENKPDLCSPSVAPTAKEVEVEVEEKRIKKKIKKKTLVLCVDEFVQMNDQELLNLIEKNGEENTWKMIDVLANYKGSKGKTYKSDYRAILSWVVDRVMKEESDQDAEFRKFRQGHEATSK